MTTLLLLKLTIAPGLVWIGTLVGRRWAPVRVASSPVSPTVPVRSLEHELRHRHIENCTIETPAKKHSVHERVELHKHMVSALLKHIYPFS